MKTDEIAKEITIREHETPVKVALKDRERMKSFLEFSLPPEKFHVLDFARFEYVDTEVLQKVLDKKSKRSFRKIRGDIIVKVGLKGMDTNMLICILMEHKSSIKSISDVFSQAVDYNQALINAGECPALNILLYHGQKPLNMPLDLKAHLGWTSQMRRVLGDSGLNCKLEVIDLSQKLDDDIREKAGLVSGLCFALKHVWNLSQDKITSAIHLILNDHVSPESDRMYKEGLSAYMLQSTNYHRDDIERLENEATGDNKEERFMLSTYDRAINEGLQKGLQEGLQEGRQEGLQEGRQEGLQEGRQEGLQAKEQSVVWNMLKMNMDLSTIIKCTGVSKERILELQKKASL